MIRRNWRPPVVGDGTGEFSAPVELPAWFDHALCPQVDIGDSFFPSSGEPSELALATCRQCPVKRQCLEYALDNEIKHGVWGGTTARQRTRLARERGAA